MTRERRSLGKEGQLEDFFVVKVDFRHLHQLRESKGDQSFLAHLNRINRWDLTPISLKFTYL